MVKIYPKTDENLNGDEKLKEYIKRYKGLEIQYSHKDNNKLVDFVMAPAVEKKIKANPEIEEITIHPPLSRYDIEQILLTDKTLFSKLLNDLVELSNKHNIKMNMILHSHLNLLEHKYFTIDDLKEGLKILEGSNVKLLLENLYMFNEDDTCSVLQVCKEIDNPHLMACIDMCHLYCRAHILRSSIEDFLEKYLDKELCEKYVYQIHLADTKNNDGYIDSKTTHGRTYDTIDKLRYDLSLLKQYGMENKLIITEVSEDDYSQREEQIKEIKFWEEIYK